MDGVSSAPERLQTSNVNPDQLEGGCFAKPVNGYLNFLP